MLKEIVESLFQNHLSGDGMKDYLDSIGSELQFELPREDYMKKKWGMTKYNRQKESIAFQVKFNGKDFNRVMITRAESGKKKLYDVSYSKKANLSNGFTPDKDIKASDLRKLLDDKLLI